LDPQTPFSLMRIVASADVHGIWPIYNGLLTPIIQLGCEQKGAVAVNCHSQRGGFFSDPDESHFFKFQAGFSYFLCICCIFWDRAAANLS
jgi:hypothetical protein